MSDISDAMERLQVRFRARAADDLDNLRRWSGDPSAYAEDLRLLTHRLAGAAGTFGFHRLSELSAAAEDALITGASDRRIALADVMDDLERMTRGVGTR
jgi:HPt (histidine-containing phosphotransfer) domain-containing protein